MGTSETSRRDPVSPPTGSKRSCRGHRQRAESDPIQHSALSWLGQRLIRCCDYSNRIFIWRARFFLPLAEQLRVCYDHTAALVALVHEVVQDCIERTAGLEQPHQDYRILDGDARAAGQVRRSRMCGVPDDDDPATVPGRLQHPCKDWSACDLLRGMYFFPGASKHTAKLSKQIAQDRWEVGVVPSRTLRHILHGVDIHLAI